MFDILRYPAAGTALLLTLAACAEPPATATAVAGARGTERSPGVHRQYGPAVALGDGHVRTYVIYDERAGGTPTEVGVALDERAMESLPGLGHASHPAASENAGENPHAHAAPMIVKLLELPPRGVAPYQFVAFDWNPAGHEPPGIYDVPHFDFHFWTASKAERAAILPTDPRWAELAARLPADSLRPPHYVVAAPPGTPPGAVAVPEMGVHWADVRSPELQPPGSPAHRPFTKTFIWGSWDGSFVFLEPMITRAHIVAKKTAGDAAVRDEIIPLTMPGRFEQPGYYPAAYRIMWDAQAREYRIALTGLSWRE